MYRPAVCAKFFSSYKSTVSQSHPRHDRSPIDSQAPTTAPPQPDVSAAPPERKDLLPWPIKTRKRGSISNPNRSRKELSMKNWGFTDLPPKKRILMAVRARRVDRFMCATCGRAFEDYHALRGHESQHRKRGCPEQDSDVERPSLQRCCGGGGDGRRCKVLRPALDINELPCSDGEEETLGLPWYGGN